MKILLANIFIFILFAACNKNSGKLPIIRFDDISAIDLKYEIPLDSVVERTEIIRFSSDKKLIIGKITLIFESKDYFFLISDDRILQFTKKGKFINFIGIQGKGPGEYISPWALDIDELNQDIFVMDFFGRKMLRYRFNGSFEIDFKFPEALNITGFKLYHDKIIYTSEVNSMRPEILIFDQNKDELLRISSSDREMLIGEAFMGTSFIMGNMEHPYLFHYFNDTVFSIEGNRLNPKYLLQFGKLKIKYEDMIIDSNERVHGPRAQVYDMFKAEHFTFVRYGVSRLIKTRGQTYLTGLYRNDLSSYSPNVNIICKENPLFSIYSGNGFFAGYDNTLLIPVSALDVLKTQPDFDILEGDNPILIKYHLR